MTINQLKKYAESIGAEIEEKRWEGGEVWIEAIAPDDNKWEYNDTWIITEVYYTYMENARATAIEDVYKAMKYGYLKEEKEEEE